MERFVRTEVGPGPGERLGRADLDRPGCSPRFHPSSRRATIGHLSVETWIRAGLCLALASVLLVQAPSAVAGEKLLHSRESAYSRIMVFQDGSVRILRFARKNAWMIETMLDMRDPYRMVHEYSAMMFLASVFVPEPKDALVVGLGGGVLPRNLRKYYPALRIDNVEIDPDVVAVAREWFGFRTDPAMTVVVSDGRVYIKRSPRKYDLVILDAALGHDIPFHLSTREFLEQVKRILKPGGVLVSNLLRGSQLYSAMRQTYRVVYPNSYAFECQSSGNVILLSPAAADRKLSKADILKLAAQAQARHRFRFSLAEQARKFQQRPDWDPKARVLTDDFAPVETMRR